jgi:hypothetical protein
LYSLSAVEGLQLFLRLLFAQRLGHDKRVPQVSTLRPGIPRTSTFELSGLIEAG